MCNDEMKKPDGMPCHHHHGHGPHGHGGPHKCKKDMMKDLDQNSLEVLLFKTARKMMHSSKEDLQSGAAFAALSAEQKEELKNLLTTVKETIKKEPKPEPAQNEQTQAE